MQIQDWLMILAVLAGSIIAVFEFAAFLALINASFGTPSKPCFI